MFHLSSLRPDPLRLTAGERALIAAATPDVAAPVFPSVLSPGCVSVSPAGDAVTECSGASSSMMPSAGCVGWTDAPPVPACRLVSYRGDLGEPMRACVFDALERWLAAALVERGCARVRLDVRGGELGLIYEDPLVLEALIPGAEFTPVGPIDLPPSFRVAPDASMAALLAGEPGEDVPIWDVLLAPGMLRGPVRITMICQAMPGGRGAWIARVARGLSGELGRLEGMERTRSIGGESVHLAPPGVAEARAAVEELRQQVLSGGERCMFAVVVEAEQRLDFDRAVALIASTFAVSTSEGIALPPRVERVSWGCAGIPVVTSMGAPVPWGIPASLSRVVQAMMPPAQPCRGLTVIDEEPGPASRLPLSAAGFSRSGEIYLGRTATGADFALPLEALCRHVVVTGATGMGKSHLAKSMVRQLIAAGISVAVLEPTSKAEYAQSLCDIPGVRVTGELPGLRRLRINPFQVDAGVRPRVWIQDLVDCLVSAYGLSEQPLPLHVRALIERLYRQHDVDLDASASTGGSWPCARDFEREIDAYMMEQTCSGPEVTANVRGALKLRASSLAGAPVFSAPDGMVARTLMGSCSWVMQLGEMGGADAAFAGMLLIARLRRATYDVNPGSLRAPRLVVAVEEAHSLLRDGEGRLTPFARLFSSCMAELRGAGVGFMVIEQRPSLLPGDVLAHAVTQVHFSNRQADDLDAVSRALGLTEGQERAFRRMGVGEAVVVCPGARAPELVKIGVGDE